MEIKSRFALCVAVALIENMGFAEPLVIHQGADEHGRAIFHVKNCSDAIHPGEAACHAHVQTNSGGAIINGSQGALKLPSGYGPNDLQAAYNVKSDGNRNITVAIVDAYGYPNAESDLAVYRQMYGLPPCTSQNGCFKKVNQSGKASNYPAFNGSWAQETALDLDMVSAMCPGCNILLVEANNNGLANLTLSIVEAISLGAKVVSNSYGGSESGTIVLNSYLKKPGVSIVASSGDNGYGAQFPASSPYVIAVGGTSLKKSSSNRRGWTETAWSKGGSGCSSVYSKPDWQIDSQCGNRMETDISAVADPGTGVAVYGPHSASSSGWMVFGGTSVSAPIVAGMIGNKGGSEGNYASAIYKNFNYNSQYFNDITSGANGACVKDASFCNAETGYDGPTGLGSPYGLSGL